MVAEQWLAVLCDPAVEALADLHSKERLGVLDGGFQHVARERDRVAHASSQSTW